jgi:glycosyltransferase involved in cell wall biosynthesis
MKVAVITPVFAIAGVPLAQLRLARALAARGYQVDVVIGWINPDYHFQPPAGINIVELKRRHVRQMLVPLKQYLLQANPAVVFSAEDHLNAVVLLAAILSGSKAKITCSSRVTPFDTYSKWPFSKRWVLKQLARLVMWRADALTCVSRDMVLQYRSVFGKTRHLCVYNIVDDQESRRRMREPLEHDWFLDHAAPRLVAAGRLAPWKGFATLIRAIGLVAPERRGKLLILGDGPLRAELQSLVRELGLEDAVRLEGYVQNPLKYFAAADVFVLASTVEGLPNVLVEAMLCGCTPVSTDCPTGPREVLADGKFGYLVPVGDPAALAEAIEQAIAHPVPTEKLNEAIRPFEANAVIDRHFEILGIDMPADAVKSAS